MNHQELVEQCFLSLLSSSDLHISSKQSKYRNKITYSLPVTNYSEFAEDELNEICQAVDHWTNTHINGKRPVVFQEIMVKATKRRHLLVRLTVQHGTITEEQWTHAFREYICNKFRNVSCICYNVATSTMRPTKEEPFHFLTSSRFVLEQTPGGLEYQISPDTFSEVNHDVEYLQWSQARAWLEELQTQYYSERVLIVSGRDVSSFGLCFSSLHRLSDSENLIFSHVIAIQHCPLVYRDAVANFARNKCSIPDYTVLQVPKAQMATSFCEELKRFAGKKVVGVMTGGRKGLDPSYIQYLAQNPDVECIIYNSCSTKSLVRDMHRLLEAGFFVDDFRSYDFLPGTAYTSSLTKLVRRPRVLILPVGPAGVGKSYTAKVLCSQCTFVKCWERDKVFTEFREKEIGLNRTKQLVHADLLAFLQQRGDTTVLYVDSTNGSADARALYVREASPDLVVLISLEPKDENGIVEFLLHRTQGRLGNNHDGHPSFPSTVEDQRQKHMNILKGIYYPSEDDVLSTKLHTTLLRKNPCKSADVSTLTYAIFVQLSVGRKLRSFIK